MPSFSGRPATQALVVFLAVLIPSLLLTPDPGSPTAALRSVALQYFLVALVPLAFAHFLTLDKRVTFSLWQTTAKNLAWSFLLAFSVLFLLDEIVLWQARLTGVQAGLNPEIRRLLRGESMLELGWIFFALAVTPAICEELLFRGFILGRLLETGHPGQSLMMSSLLFGLFHRNLPTLLPTTLAGVVLAFVVWRTGSLYCAIVIHAVINTWAIFVVNTSLGELLPWTSQSSHVPTWLLLVSVVVVAVSAKQLQGERAFR